jgi:hypothetical protein
MNAEDFLDGLHESIYRSLGQPAPGDRDLRADPGVLRAIGDVVSTYRLDGAGPEAAAGMLDVVDSLVNETTSKYENPFMIKILRTRAAELEFAARKRNVPFPVPPLLGTLPHGEVNARTLLVPGTNQHIVLFESEMFLFLHLVAKAVAQVVPAFIDADGRLHVLAGDHARESIAAEPGLARRFTEVLLFYATTGQPGRATPYIQQPDKEVLTDKLRTGMELFVLGHEYGHVQCGHLGERKAAADLGGDDAPEEMLYSWIEEIQADGVGFGLAIQPALVDGLGIDLMVAAADLYFTVLDLFDRAMQLLRAGNEDVPISATHPPHLVRRDGMEKALRARYGDDDRIFALSIHLRNVAHLLWEQARPELLRLHQMGTRPETRWR